jgi:cell division septation protein DedD
MTQTDDEKELVLGNKQLISLFFVIVALCGVFFAMGYMIGRNTSKSAATNLDGNTAPVASAPPPQSQTPEPPRETSAEETPPPSPALVAETQPASSRVVTQPAHDTATAPEAGATWLQVTALRRPDADNLVRTLREQNFPVLLAGSSKPDLFRVMVGPYRQNADLAEAKERLKALGFANAFVQK